MNFFNRLRIYEPKDICTLSIVKELRIFLRYHSRPSNYERHGNYKAILIEKGLSNQQERLEFFHELGHLLRHSGSQLFMRKEFAELQEWDAKHFEFYAAMPWSMMTQFDLNSPHIIEELSEAFVVPEEFVNKKLEFVHRKHHEYQLFGHSLQV
jgi:Zn-dependent peptidase ImmA (M78 family)